MIRQDTTVRRTVFVMIFSGCVLSLAACQGASRAEPKFRMPQPDRQHGGLIIRHCARNCFAGIFQDPAGRRHKPGPETQARWRADERNVVASQTPRWMHSDVREGTN